MRHDTSETDSDTAVQATPTRGRRLAANLASYTLFGVALAAFYLFFAPHVGLPDPAVAEKLPSIIAPTEGRAVVDVFPAIVGAAAAGVAVWLR